MGLLFNQVCNPDNLLMAWQQVRKKGSAGGIDGQDIAEIDQSSSKYIKDLSIELAYGQYNPEPYYKIEVPKRIGSPEKRTLGLPTIKDKIAQQSVRNVIEPIFEDMFLDISYGYRPNKGPLKAIKRVRHMITAEKRHWVTVCDIDKFFDTLNHEKLFNLIEEKIQEKEILQLLNLWVKMGNVDKHGRWTDREMGVPQGGILSPLMSNIYLHPFDVYMTQKMHGMVRYCDDFIILSRDEQTAQQALTDCQDFLNRELRLSLNSGYEIRELKQGFTYMGFMFKEGEISIDNEKIKRIKTKIHFTCKNNFDKPIDVFVNQINEVIAGLCNYYSNLAPLKQLQQIDDYSNQNYTSISDSRRN